MNLAVVPNGIYDLVLRVHGGFRETNAVVRILLDTELKLGRLTFSEQDLVIPVSGIPLTVLRRYDSFDPTEGELGYGWRMALSDMQVALDDDRESKECFLSTGSADNFDGSVDYLDIRTGGGHNVTLTLPGGRRVTFGFKPRRGPLVVHAEWDKPAGAGVKAFVMMGDNVIAFYQNGWGVPVWCAGDPRTPYECFDVPGWNLTMLDGTQYEIGRDPIGESGVTYYIDYLGDSSSFVPVSPYGRPKLTKIKQRTGDSLVISTNGGAHYPPSGQNPTRSILFERDSNNLRPFLPSPRGRLAAPSLGCRHRSRFRARRHPARLLNPDEAPLVNPRSRAILSPHERTGL